MEPFSSGADIAGPRSILYLHTTSEVGGSDVSLLRLVERLDRTRFHPVVALPASGPLVGRLEAAGCEVVIEPCLRKLTRRRGPTYLLRVLLNYPRAVARLARLVSARRIELVHTNTIHNLYGIGAAIVDFDLWGRGDQFHGHNVKPRGDMEELFLVQINQGDFG